MKFTNFGNTGITVSGICLGCMSYGGGAMPAWAQGTKGWHVGKEDAREHFAMALEAALENGRGVFRARLRSGGLRAQEDGTDQDAEKRHAAASELH